MAQKKQPTPADAPAAESGDGAAGAPLAGDGAAAAKKSADKKASKKPSATARTRPAAAPAHADGANHRGFPIVGVGASAGGLEALEELLRNMSAKPELALVIVTHQHPGHTSLLPDLLTRSTRMPVVEASDGLKLRPNHVYVGTPGCYLAIRNGTLSRIETGPEKSPTLPIDYFFHSLADDQQEKAVCIVLSGTGSDGTLGLKAIKAASGMAIVETPQSAKYAGMPASAVATGLADFVLPPAAMAEQLLALVKGTGPTGFKSAAEPLALADEPLQKIFAVLRDRTGHDFSSYKTNTLRRRIERRMNVHQIENVDQYAHYLQENPHEVDILFKELLIRVTKFFRDPEAWNALLDGPLPDLIASRPEGYHFRAWVPGCATGEEVYSLIIGLRECRERMARQFEIQVFGTDLDAQAIETARQGQYPDEIATDVSELRLARYFTHSDHRYRIRKDVRELAVFAPQNVVRDPPFTKLDLISCRNLLIYLNADLQKRLLPILHYALNPGGLLFLGPSETGGSFGELFETVDKHWKILRRRQSVGHAGAAAPIPLQLAHRADRHAERTPGMSAAHDPPIGRLVERLLLGSYAPVSVVVNDRYDVIYVHGRTGNYLEPAQGQPRNNLLEMAREGLQHELASALRQVYLQDKNVVRENIRVKTNGDYSSVTLSVSRIQDPEPIRGLLLVTFAPTSPQQPAHPPAPAAEKREPDEKDAGPNLLLEQELQRMRESNQVMLEELEASNEELKSTNEELQSTNEELQSTNEELETSKEELQSLNEEMTTINAELQSKIDEISQGSTDMESLLNSTDIATVFLDEGLNIKRFTAQAKDLVMLRQTDLNRPITELASNLEHHDLAKDCHSVLRTLAFKEREVRTKDGTWYLMRIMPYRTAENMIAGLVLTFVDISRLKTAQQNLRRMSKVFMASVDPMILVGLKGEIIDLNDSASRDVKLSRNDLMGQPVTRLIADTPDLHLKELLARCRTGETIHGSKCALLDSAGKQLPGTLTLMPLSDEQRQPDAIAVAVRRDSQ